MVLFSLLQRTQTVARSGPLLDHAWLTSRALVVWGRVLLSGWDLVITDVLGPLTGALKHLFK